MTIPHSAPLPIACILFALAREAGAFYRSLGRSRPLPGAPCPARFFSHPRYRVLALQTGVGANAIERALDWLLKHQDQSLRPSHIISAGYGGALRDDLAIGDLVLAAEVVDEAGNRWPTAWPVVKAIDYFPKLKCGRILSVDRAVGDPTLKRVLGERHGAVAVDMETATVARICAASGVPFGCLRSISDTAATPISARLLDLAAGSPLRVAAACAISPRLAVECWRLAAATHTASKTLAASLRAFLDKEEMENPL